MPQRSGPQRSGPQSSGPQSSGPQSSGGRALVIGGNPGRWNYVDADAPYRVTNGVEAWVSALCGDYWGGTAPPRQHLAQYDLVIANLNPWLIPQYVPLVEDPRRTVRWVSLVEGGGESYLDPSPALQRVLDASDLVAVLNPHTTGYFRHLCHTQVAWIGIPFPIEAIAALGTPYQERRMEVLVCPRQQRRPSFVVADALHVPVRAYFEKTSRKLRNLPLFVRHRYFGRDLKAQLWRQEKASTPRIACLERELPDFWREAGGCLLWIDLDPRTTWARYVLDAAALGVPMISTENTAHAPLLFPETTVRDVFCVEEAIAIGQRLLTDTAFARRVTQTARERLDRFAVEVCVRRLTAALGGEEKASTASDAQARAGQTSGQTDGQTDRPADGRPDGQIRAG